MEVAGAVLAAAVVLELLGLKRIALDLKEYRYGKKTYYS